MSPSHLTILAYEETPLGPICLRRRELLSAPGTVVTEVTLEHQFLMSSLHNGGVLGVWSYAGSSPFARALEATFEEVHLERVTFYVDMVEEERTDWLFFARSPDLPGVTGT